jgi:hypothetical protein
MPSPRWDGNRQRRLGTAELAGNRAKSRRFEEIHFWLPGLCVRHFALGTAQRPHDVRMVQRRVETREERLNGRAERGVNDVAVLGEGRKDYGTLEFEMLTVGHTSLGNFDRSRFCGLRSKRLGMKPTGIALAAAVHFACCSSNQGTGAGKERDAAIPPAAGRSICS